MALKKTKEETKTNKEDKPDYIGHRQRLKARFLVDNGRSMPDYELLELILMFALPRKDVKPLAKQLIKEYKTLASVLTAPSVELVNFPGLGHHAATLFTLIHSCVNKICWENLEKDDSPVLKDKKEIIEYCRTKIGYSKQENLLVVYLTNRGKYLKHSIEQVGTASAVMISPQDIARSAILNHATGVIISHNHPSDDCSPSNADIEMTSQLKRGLAAVGIKLIDHIIISQSNYYSFVEKSYFMKDLPPLPY
ncbi:MAG: DNA repair protein RadC [Alphaproteobacteria bacterium]|nr:DNA repair protein RadC [Alphaproteobacteria bacterium]